ncbi:acyl carrier protein [Catenibacterium sp.]|uniref:acyl carrier protein n=1 Tax=Catenibacterium sp. TaxID=2049022 RepID=UPI003FD8B1E1
MNYFDKIKEALSSKLKGQELTLDSNLRDLGIDSLDVVDLIMDLEEELGIEFSDEELMSIHTEEVNNYTYHYCKNKWNKDTMEYLEK